MIPDPETRPTATWWVNVRDEKKPIELSPLVARVLYHASQINAPGLSPHIGPAVTKLQRLGLVTVAKDGLTYKLTLVGAHALDTLRPKGTEITKPSQGSLFDRETE